MSDKNRNILNIVLAVVLVGIIITILVIAVKKNQTDSPEPTPTYNAKEKIHEHCTRTGIVTEGNADLSYEIYYTGEILNKVEATERVTSTSTEILDQYEGAYKAIHAHYEGLKYYDTKVIRTDSSVTSKITIDYDRIDIDELISIEGTETNVFEDKVPKIAKWKELAEKVGTRCTIVE